MCQLFYSYETLRWGIGQYFTFLYSIELIEYYFESVELTVHSQPRALLRLAYSLAVPVAHATATSSVSHRITFACTARVGMALQELVCF